MRYFSGTIPSVQIAGEYAFVPWEIPGGGMNFYLRRSGRWANLVGGGGALSACELTRDYGVPLPIASRFVPLNYAPTDGAKTKTTC